MLDKINGMFAFSIWNKNTDTLFIARDRLGIKPLYYHTNKNGLIFSSTLNSMINLYEKKIDEDSILFYLFAGYIPSPKTIWKNFYKLEPGHYITIKNNNIKQITPSTLPSPIPPHSPHLALTVYIILLLN